MRKTFEKLKELRRERKGCEVQWTNGVKGCSPELWKNSLLLGCIHDPISDCPLPAPVSFLFLSPFLDSKHFTASTTFMPSFTFPKTTT